MKIISDSEIKSKAREHLKYSGYQDSVQPKPEMATYLKAICESDSPYDLQTHIKNANEYIRKHKDEVYPDELKQDLADMKKYIDIRVDYTNLFAVSKALAKMLEKNTGPDDEFNAKLRSLKQNIDILQRQAESGNDDSKNIKKATLDMLKLVGEFRKNKSLKSDPRLTAEICSILDEVQLIVKAIKTQEENLIQQNKAISTFEADANEFNSYMKGFEGKRDSVQCLTSGEKFDLVRMKRVKDRKEQAVATSADELLSIYSSTANNITEDILWQHIKKLDPTIDDSPENKQAIKDLCDKLKEFGGEAFNKECSKLLRQCEELSADKVAVERRISLAFNYLVRDTVLNSVANNWTKDNNDKLPLVRVMFKVIESPEFSADIEAGALSKKIGVAVADKNFLNVAAKNIAQIEKKQEFRKKVQPILELYKQSTLDLDFITRVYGDKYKIDQDIKKLEKELLSYNRLPMGIRKKAIDSRLPTAMREGTSPKIQAIENRIKVLEEQSATLNEFLKAESIKKVISATQATGVSLEIIAMSKAHDATVVSTYNQGQDPVLAGNKGHCAGIAINFAKMLKKNPDMTLDGLQEKYKSKDVFHLDQIGITKTVNKYQRKQNKRKLETAESRTVVTQKSAIERKNAVTEAYSAAKESVTKSYDKKYVRKEKGKPLAESINSQLTDILHNRSDAERLNNEVFIIGIYGANSGHAMLVSLVADGCVFMDSNRGIFHFKNDEQSSGFDKFKGWFKDYMDNMYKGSLDKFYELTDVGIKSDLAIGAAIDTIENHSEMSADENTADAASVLDYSLCLRHASKFADENDFEDLVKLMALTHYHENVGAHANASWTLKDNEILTMNKILMDACQNAVKMNSPHSENLKQQLDDFQVHFKDQISKAQSTPMLHVDKKQYPSTLKMFESAVLKDQKENTRNKENKASAVNEGKNKSAEKIADSTADVTVSRPLKPV